MRSKWFFMGVVVVLGLMGCNPAGASITPEPSIREDDETEAAVESPEDFFGVHIRLENRMEEIEQADLSYPHQSERFVAIGAGEITEYRTFEYAYQSIGMLIEVGEESWIIEGLDYVGEVDNPITAGYYTVVLERSNGNVLTDLRPDTRPGIIDPIIARLEAGGATITHQPSVQRANVFEQLSGETLAWREIFFIEEERVDVYVFESVAEAERVAGMVMPNGNLSYAVDGGEVQQTMDSGMGAPLFWWQSDRYLYFYEGLDADLPHILTLTTGAEPLNQWLSAGAETVQIRVQNGSGVAFEGMVVNFVGQEVDYGMVPAGQSTAYETISEAYHYASFRIEAEGEVYEIMAIDYVGETPLPAGNYTYVFDIDSGNAQQAVFNDTLQPILTDLVDQDWYWVRTELADGGEFVPSQAGNRAPYIHFTTDISPNQGEVGYVLTGHAACNGMFGTYLPNNYNAFILPLIGQNETLCAEEVMETELAFMGYLNGIIFYYFEGELLQLFTGSGDVLIFSREPAGG